jgi:hypothetical protein
VLSPEAKAQLSKLGDYFKDLDQSFEIEEEEVENFSEPKPLKVPAAVYASVLFVLLSNTRLADVGSGNPSPSLREPNATLPRMFQPLRRTLTSTRKVIFWYPLFACSFCPLASCPNL